MQITEVKTFLDLLKYIFQKRIFKQIDRHEAHDYEGGMVKYYVYVFQDQFGNIKHERVK